MIMNSFLLILNFLHLNVNFDRFHPNMDLQFHFLNSGHMTKLLSDTMEGKRSPTLCQVPMEKGQS